MTTKLRKAPKSYRDLKDNERYQLLSMYSSGDSTKDIAKHFGISLEVVQTAIAQTMRKLETAAATQMLNVNVNYKAPKTPDEINKNFTELEVPDNGMTYAFYYGLTNDNRYALKQAGLDKSIPCSHKDTKMYNRAVKSRGLYLRSIPEINKEIKAVRLQQLHDNSVDKPYVVSEILEQIAQLKETTSDTPRRRGHIVKLIKMLGDTVGAFTTHITVDKVSPEDSLDKLIELATQVEVKEIN